MKKLILLGLAAAIASAAMASTTFSGQTGLTVTPNAAVAPVDTVNVAVDYLDSTKALYPIRVNYGVAENWEAGINHTMNGKIIGVSGKWVTPLTALDSKYAVGASIQSLSKTVLYNVYGSMTKELPLGFEDVAVNLNAAIVCTAGPGTTNLTPALGVDATFANAGNLNVAAEYLFRGNGIVPSKGFALKASYDLGDGFGVQAGVTDAYAGNGKIFVGGNYTYDLAK
jgi:hypothetical protein